MKLTMAQALIRFLASQYVERDGVEHRFFAGCWGIFGHGNVAGIGEALQELPDGLPFFQARNEQAMVHAAAGFARMSSRMATFACTTSIGPGATNMVTGAAAATINRLPVLLLPGDVFASRASDPALQQLETPWAGDVSVNDVFRPVSRYFDRIMRPEQIVPAALAAMRVLTSPADTGAVTLALPQDVQTEAFDVPADFLAKRVWHYERRRPDEAALRRAAQLIAAAKRPLVVAGGGVIYSGATDALRAWVDARGIPVGETQAGKGSLPYDHPLNLGAIGATGMLAANRIARVADVVIGIGTRWSDFTTASNTVFQNPDLRFVNVNVVELDAHKNSGIALVGDARVTLEALAASPARADAAYRAEAQRLHDESQREVDRLYALGSAPLPAQSEVIGAVNSIAGPRDVVVCAAGSLPGDLHKLWRTRDPHGYQVEYGYSTMGYEIAGGLGVKLAAPDRDVYVLVGDGSYLMLAQEIVTSLELQHKLIVVLVDNQGFASIGALSRSLGSGGFGTERTQPVDFAANAASLGAIATSVRTIAELCAALEDAKRAERTTVITIATDKTASVPSYESWWSVVPAEVSTLKDVRAARERYGDARRKQRRHLKPE